MINWDLKKLFRLFVSKQVHIFLNFNATFLHTLQLFLVEFETTLSFQFLDATYNLPKNILF